MAGTLHQVIMKPLKNALGHLMFASRLNALLLGRTGVVVAFHRVHEDRDVYGLSVDCRAFERYCQFFRQHFRVIPLGELIAKLERGEPLNRHLSITFDDGYRDNFENAVPVLERLALPATFFIVSQWIGSNVVPWWDAHGPRHTWMTWEQVRELRRRGFEVGSHTRTHPDLGSITGPVAVKEILGGRLEVEERLEERIDLFAYPYGGWQHMADSNRELVKAAGFRCCCSCYGGVTMNGDDPFRLQRVAISPWYSSPHQFGFELVRGMRPLSVSRMPCCGTSEATGQ
jgi:peptidoglycan/xylan/chitin deacetylase (PgdA/CDA1 family)